MCILCVLLEFQLPANPTEKASKRRDDDQDEDEENPLYPVMVFIHSGLFMSGSASAYDAKYFMDEKVVLVTMNYRLGSFGESQSCQNFHQNTCPNFSI